MSVAARNVKLVIAHRAGLLQEKNVTVLDFTTASDLRLRSRGLPTIDVVQLHNELWRITRSTGEVLGYIERFVDRGEFRFRAKRMIVRQNRFVPIGEFWSMDDALDCFRVG